MKIGWRIPYANDDATAACLQVCRLAIDFGHDVEIYSTERITSVHPIWDRHLIRPAKMTFDDWLTTGISQLYYLKPPDITELERIKTANIAVHLLLLWDILQDNDADMLSLFDKVISPSRSATKLFTQAGITNLFPIPWDSGVPITFEPRSVDPKHLGVIWPLEGSQVVRQEPKFLQVANMLLEFCNNVWLTIIYAVTLPNHALRELRKLAQYADGRVELMHDLPVERQELLFGHHDLTIWPTLIENTGIVGLTSLAMSAPIVAFDHPVIGEFIRDGKNGHLVPCELEINTIGVPYVTPDYYQFSQQLINLINEPEQLNSMRELATVGLSERQATFIGRWKKMLQDD